MAGQIANVSKWQLAAMLFAQGSITVYIPDVHGVTHVGMLQSIQREDGSGRAFNLTLAIGNDTETIFLRTID